MTQLTITEIAKLDSWHWVLVIDNQPGQPLQFSRCFTFKVMFSCECIFVEWGMVKTRVCEHMRKTRIYHCLPCRPNLWLARYPCHFVFSSPLLLPFSGQVWSFVKITWTFPFAKTKEWNSNSNNDPVTFEVTIRCNWTICMLAQLVQTNHLQTYAFQNELLKRRQS